MSAAVFSTGTPAVSPQESRLAAATKATISHDRDLLYNLHEGGFARMQSIQEAMKALDRGQYGERAACGIDINEKRLAAIPWATTCIDCQEKAEMETKSSHMVAAGAKAF